MYRPIYLQITDNLKATIYRLLTQSNRSKFMYEFNEVRAKSSVVSEAINTASKQIKKDSNMTYSKIDA